MHIGFTLSVNWTKLKQVGLWRTWKDFIARLKGTHATWSQSRRVCDVSTCISFHFSVLTPVVWKVWR